MKDCTNLLIEYFRAELPKLPNNYNWKIPDISGFYLSGSSGYEANVELKKYLNKVWKESDIKDKYHLSNVIVSDWGGVRSNNPSTLHNYVDELHKNTPSTPLKGVASYSKIFSISNMEKYAIYDARVAACLNAVQWNSNIVEGVAFNYISGRNNITGHAEKKIGFTQQEEFKVKKLCEQGWKRLKRDETYNTYLNILSLCLDSFSQYNLYDLEMVLFANAEKECRLAMDNLSAKSRSQHLTSGSS